MFSSLNNGFILKFNVAIQIFMLQSNINKGNLLDTIQGNNPSTQKYLKFGEKKRGWDWGLETSLIRTKVLNTVPDMTPFFSLVPCVLSATCQCATSYHFWFLVALLYTCAKSMFKILINLTFIYVNINLKCVGQHMFNEQYKENNTA